MGKTYLAAKEPSKNKQQQDPIHTGQNLDIPKRHGKGRQRLGLQTRMASIKRDLTALTSQVSSLT